MVILLPSHPSGYGKLLEKANPSNIGYLVTPRRMLSFLRKQPEQWAVDNDCYNLADKFDFANYCKCIEAMADYQGQCLFINVPDVVGDAAATASRWNEYAPALRQYGRPLAYCLQDGQITLPQVEHDAVFIGGSDRYKLGQEVRQLAIEAKAAGKWVHMGRCNTVRRMLYAKAIGCDSIDGTALGLAPQQTLQKLLNGLDWQRQQLNLME